MKVLITGGKGLLAHAIRQLAPANWQLTLWDIEEFDLTKPASMAALLAELRPDWLINTAAYNLVDRCEQERDLSWAVNAEGPRALAQLCAGLDCPLVHFSSDYVFDGAKNAPYVETDSPNPLNHYGAGKLFGEKAVLGASPRNLALRTSWLFGPHPTQTKSYIHAVLGRAGAGAALKATTDQMAAPTYAPDLAAWTLRLVQTGASGLFHAVNDEGLSRYDWTLAVLAAARRAGLLEGEVTVEPVLSSVFNSTMRRPAYTILDNQKAASALGGSLGSWRVGLERMLQDWRTGVGNSKR
jgi:dTDP-4-dehydrorhamnose reductase